MHNIARFFIQTAQISPRNNLTAIVHNLRYQNAIWARYFLLFTLQISLLGLLSTIVLSAEIQFPANQDNAPITITGDSGFTWTEGAYEVWQLNQCQLRQGSFSAQGQSAVLWIDRTGRTAGLPNNLIVYFEGDNTRIEQQRIAGLHQVQNNHSTPANRILTDNQWFGRLSSSAAITVTTEQTLAAPRTPTNVFNRAMARWKASQSQTAVQFASHQDTNPELNRTTTAADNSVGIGKHRLRLQGRSNVNWSLHVEQNTTGGGSLAIAKSGVRVTIDGIQAGDSNSSLITIETDSMVLWGPAFDQLRGGSITDSNTPIEVYLEGNIIFRQDDRVIYADRMYYNVTQEQGMILNAEVLTPVNEYDGLMRIKADVLQQVNRQTFRAYGTAITSSRMGIPGYWLQSDKIEIVDRQQPSIDPITGKQKKNAVTGEPVFDHQVTATSKDNFLFFDGVPIFYWPSMSSRVDDSSFYLDRIRLKTDRVYGQQLLIDWNAFQLFNVAEVPENTTWSLSTDLLSERGVAFGTLYEYQRDDMFDLPGLSRGQLDAWGLQDQGTDNLGRDRRNVTPEHNFRGRIFWQHRQLSRDGIQLSAEVGLISDRNFMEQFYERVWDQEKDPMTGVELKKITDNRVWNLAANIRVNDFFTQTDWLPKLDHYWLGESIFADRATWHEHTSIGFGQLKPATTPLDVAEQAKFDLMAGEEQKYSGIRAASRQEIDFPMQWGNVKVTPYLLGEAAYWGDDISHQSVTRTYGQVGIRSSLPMSRTDPNIKSKLFNVSGLAHKVNWMLDAYWADASENMDRFPRYDALDDDAQEHYRRRFFFDTFGGIAGQNIASKWDERMFAYRANMQGNVTSPVTEIADDAMTFRLATEQRWQTKRGIVGKQHLVDWMVLNAEILLFPDADNNEGQHTGMFDYDYRWHVGDRFTILSDGYFDFYSGGLKTVSVGGVLSRPENGRLFLGYRMIDGPISSHILHAAASYKMSQKWIAIIGTSFDLGDTGNIGQSLSLVRVGESILVRAGINYDESRDNFGVHLTIEPRLLGNGRIARLTGIHTPPAGSYGLE